MQRRAGNRNIGKFRAAKIFCSNSYKFEIRLLDTPRYSSSQPRYVFEGVTMKSLVSIVSLAVGALAIGASTSAMARVDIGVNIGIPAPVYVTPAPVYVAPPPPVIYQPAPVYMAPAVVIGWHGDRYWDGRRWWDRDEWGHRGWDHDRGWDHGRGHGWGHEHGHGHGDD